VCVGCGDGVVCNGPDSSTAHCDRCDFDHLTHHCSYYLLDAHTAISDTAQCVQGPVIVYTGTQLSFTGSHCPVIYIAERTRKIQYDTRHF